MEESMILKQLHKAPHALLLAALVFLLVGIVPAQAAPLSQSGVERIQFAPGATGATIINTLSGAQPLRYALGALAGQTLRVQVEAEGAPVFATLLAPNRAVLGTTVGSNPLVLTLPSTGDYLLVVNMPPTTETIGFRLRVEIPTVSTPPIPTPIPPTTPTRIQFAPGAISAQVTGYLPSGGSASYLLNARANQVMTIESWSTGGSFNFTVVAADGTPLGKVGMGGYWSRTLPFSQDYRIDLQSPTSGQGVNYGLVITIQGAVPTPTPVPQPVTQRIQFAPGATSTTVWGFVNSSTPARYVLRALRGQTMSVQLNRDAGYPARMTISDAQGNFLGAANQGELWSGTLSATQDYYVTVQAPADSVGDDFSLWIGIR
jgi:hypothetical protein